MARKKAMKSLWHFHLNLIANEFYFSGSLTDSPDPLHNDTFVWELENKGISLDAGIVFLPADAQVDTTTGSRYSYDEQQNVRMQGNIEIASQIVQDLRFLPIQQKIEKEYYNAYDQPHIIKEIAADGIRQLQSTFSIDEKLAEALIDQNAMREFQYAKYIGDPESEASALMHIEFGIQDTLQRHDLRYCLAEQPINSKQYWENYFKENPQLKPSKIVYYMGGDPTAALNAWRAEHGITKRASDDARHHLGFPENVPDDTIYTEIISSPARRERFRNLAINVISEYYNVLPEDIEKTVQKMFADSEKN